MPSRFRGLWRHPDFLRLWGAQAVSLLGTGLGALPFTAILFLDATGTQMALLMAAQTLPALLIGLVAGAWVDRARKRPVLIVADLGRAVALLSLPAAAAFDALAMEQLYAVALVNGALAIFFDIAHLSYLPALVRRDELVEANGKLASSAAVAEAGAFSLGGWISQIFGALVAVVADAVSYLVSAFLVARIQSAEPPREAVDDGQGVMSEVTGGAVAVRRNPVLLGLAGAVAADGLASGLIGSAILLFGNKDLGLSAGVLGMIFGVGGVTALAGASVSGGLAARFGAGRTLAGAQVLGTVGLLFVVLAPAGLPFVAAMLLVASQLVSDPCRAIAEVNAISIRQDVTSDSVLGRVNAMFRVTELTAMLLGAGLAAVVAPAFGLRATLAVGAVFALAVPVAILLSPAARVRMETRVAAEA